LFTSIPQWSIAGLHSEEEESNSMYDLIVPLHSYFIIDVSLQSRLAKEMLELLDIGRSTGTQNQQPLFILSL
jgi:hypothetical protein